MRRLTIGLAVAFLCLFGREITPSNPARGQQPPKPVTNPIPVAPSKRIPSPRFRGHVTPKNIDMLRRMSYQRNQGRLAAMKAVPPPATWDSRANGWVGPIKDQGQCGSCWDFSGTGVVEIACDMAGIGGGPNTFILSEQYTLDCGSNGGCNGDDNTTVLQWAKSTGLPLTSVYGPYQAGSSNCNYSSAMKLFQISDWGYADSNGGNGITSVADVKAAIMTYGCVGAAVAADNAFEAWGDNNPSMSSPFLGSGAGPNQIDHDIILVGWVDVPSMTSGGYWILRNSWGKDWGIGGYMSIAYNANQVGTESVFAVPPTSPVPVNVPPAFTSTNTVTFTPGVVNTFTVATTGTAPVTITESGTLPAGITFASGTFSGTPTTTGTYTITLTATNAVGSAMQEFTLIVSQSPVPPNPNSVTANFGVYVLTITPNGGTPVPTPQTPPPPITVSVGGQSITISATINPNPSKP